VIIEVIGIFVPSGIANAAHLAGLASGLIYGIYLKKQRKQFNRRISTKQHLDTDDIQEYMRSGRI
jgi:membrane associated rhomboid family serine protease